MLIYSSYQSSDNCSDLDNDKCDQYTPPEGDDGTKQCLPVGENGKCALKSCEELSYSDCNKYNPIGNGADIQNCFSKSEIIGGEPECELKKCNEIDNGNCQAFETKSNEYKCLDIYDEAKGESKCIYVSCSDLTNNCDYFHFEDEEYQCVEKRNRDGCEKKKCTELEGERCYAFRVEGLHACIQNENGDGCQYKTCEQLKPDQCSHYALYDEHNGMCYETDDGKGCEYKKCEDFSPPFCYKFSPRYAGFNCIEENGKCFERQCSDYKPPNCRNFESVNHEAYICDVDPENENTCIERSKKCEEYSYFSCKDYNWNNYNSDVDKEECVQKEDKTGCELKSCTNMAINECEKFIPVNEDEKCLLNSAGNKCEIQKCSEQNENSCNAFVPNDKSKKCANDGVGCQLTNKQCSDFSVDECYYYDLETLVEDEMNPNACLPNSNNNGCELKHCGDLNSNECSKFNPKYDDDLQCISIGNQCQLIPCESLANNECSKFKTDNLSYKCIPGESGCMTENKECSELPASFCVSPFQYENGQKCVLNNEGTGCMLKGKSHSGNPNQNTGNNGESKDPANSSDSKKGKESENDSKNSSNIIQSFILKILLFLFLL